MEETRVSDFDLELRNVIRAHLEYLTHGKGNPQALLSYWKNIRYKLEILNLYEYLPRLETLIESVHHIRNSENLNPEQKGYVLLCNFIFRMYLALGWMGMGKLNYAVQCYSTCVLAWKEFAAFLTQENDKASQYTNEVIRNTLQSLKPMILPFIEGYLRKTNPTHKLEDKNAHEWNDNPRFQQALKELVAMLPRETIIKLNAKGQAGNSNNDSKNTDVVVEQLLEALLPLLQMLPQQIVGTLKYDLLDTFLERFNIRKDIKSLYPLLVELYINAGDIDTASTFFEQGTNLEFYALHWIPSIQSDYRKRQKLQEIAHNNELPGQTRALIHMLLGDFDTPIQIFQESRNSSEYSICDTFNLGDCYLRRNKGNDLEEAVRCFKECYEKNQEQIMKIRVGAYLALSCTATLHKLKPKDERELKYLETAKEALKNEKHCHEALFKIIFAYTSTWLAMYEEKWQEASGKADLCIECCIRTIVDVEEKVPDHMHVFTIGAFDKLPIDPRLEELLSIRQVDKILEHNPFKLSVKECIMRAFDLKQIIQYKLYSSSREIKYAIEGLICAEQYRSRDNGGFNPQTTVKTVLDGLQDHECIVFYSFVSDYLEETWYLLTWVVCSGNRIRQLCQRIKNHDQTSFLEQRNLSEVNRSYRDIPDGIKPLGAVDGRYVPYLVEPIYEILKNWKCRLLFFVPQGKLFFVPFTNFKLANGNKLIQEFQIAVIPSLYNAQQKFASQTIADGTDVLLIGDPLGENSVSLLPSASREIFTIYNSIHEKGGTLRATVCPLAGSQFTESNVKRKLEICTQQIIHFVSHSSCTLQRTTRYYEISGALQATEGWIYASDIASLNLQHVKLVVLASCDSAIGNITSSEGLLGFYRAFLEKDVSTIIASVTRVADDQTADLMISFYKHLNQGKTIMEAFQLSSQECDFDHNFILIGR